MIFKCRLADWITLIENWLSIPHDYAQLELWMESAEKLAHDHDFTDHEMHYVDRILEMYDEEFRLLIEKHAANPNKSIVSKEFMDNLLSREQIEQRTPEWYAQMANIISASELGQLFASERTRAKLVVAKTLPYVSRNQQLAVPSDSMSAFDWGIRFEPVVKLIYNFKHGTTIKELGRLHHPVDKRCTASPDGLIYECPEGIRTGRLIEIKCPVTREIDGSIPKDYYAQMQMQMQVTQCTSCDYVEAEFASPYNNMPIKNGVALCSGLIALIRAKEPEFDPITFRYINIEQQYRYEYGPVNDLEWQPSLFEGEELQEMIPWKLIKWSEQNVKRNEQWWDTLQPAINKFWEDVEKARRGEFGIPESTRQKKHPKEEKCAIVFVNKIDDTTDIDDF
jgi:hypothetical protein